MKPHVVAFFITSLILTSCTSSVTEPYIHFNQKHNVHLEFDYPSSWLLYERGEFSNIDSICLDDPRFETLSTPSPPNYHPTPNNYGFICIWITEVESGHESETEVEALKKNYNLEIERLRFTILDSYELIIAEQKSSVLEYYDNEPMEGYYALMFNRRIFFIVDNQMYQIFFSVAEEERGGEFEQGYEYFLSSLNVTP